MALINQPTKSILQMSRQAMRLYLLSLRKQYWLLIIMALLVVLNMSIKQDIVNIIVSLLLFYVVMIFTQTLGALYQGQKPQVWQRCRHGFFTYLSLIFTLIVITFISLAIFAVMALVFAIAGFIVSLLLHLVLRSDAVFHTLLLVYGALFAICYVLCFIYINIAFYITMPLVAIKNHPPFVAIAESFRLVKGKRKFLLGSYIYIGFITFIMYALSIVIIFILMNIFHLSLTTLSQSGVYWILLSAPGWLALNFFVLPLTYALAVVVMFSLIKQNRH